MPQFEMVTAGSGYEIVLIVASIGILLIFWFGIKWWFFSRKTIAEILLQPDAPFDLRFYVEKPKKMAMRFEFDFTHGGGEKDFGAVVDLGVDINGQITQDVVGVGNQIHMPVNRVITNFFMGQDRESSKGARSKATVILVRFVLNPGNQVIITGAVHLEPETQPNHMKIYVVE